MLLRGKLALWLIGGFFFLLAWAISQGLLGWSKDKYACYHGRGFYNAVDKQRLMSIGKLQIYYQPKTWGCTEIERYDPKQYKMENGTLKNIESTDLTQ